MPCHWYQLIPCSRSPLVAFNTCGEAVGGQKVNLLWFPFFCCCCCCCSSYIHSIPFYFSLSIVLFFSNFWSFLNRVKARSTLTKSWLTFQTNPDGYQSQFESIAIKFLFVQIARVIRLVWMFSNISNGMVIVSDSNRWGSNSSAILSNETVTINSEIMTRMMSTQSDFRGMQILSGGGRRGTGGGGGGGGEAGISRCFACHLIALLGRCSGWSQKNSGSSTLDRCVYFLLGRF